MAKLRSGTRIYGTAGIDTSLTVGSGVTISSTSISATGISTFSGGLLVGTGASISSPATNVLTLGTNNTESVRLDSSGNIGIGTTGTSDKLTVFGRVQIQQDNISNGNSRLVFRGVPSSPYRWNIDNNASSNTFRIFREDDATAANGAVIIGISTSGNLQLSAAGGRVLNSSGNPILQQTGSVLQVGWKNLGSGSFSATSTSPTYRATGYTNTITPISTSSRIFHIVTIGCQFICDGQIVIYRNGSQSSGSLMDSYRDGITASYTVDMPAYTFTYLDTTPSSSTLNYELYCRSTGCGGVMFVGSSGDFDASWTIMEIAN